MSRTQTGRTCFRSFANPSNRSRPHALHLHSTKVSLMEFLCYCLLVFMTVLLCLVIHHYSFKKPKLLPPGPWQLPVIGCIHHLLRGSKIPQRKLRDLAGDYGPLMHLKLGQLHAVVVSSKHAAEEMFKTHDLQVSDKADNVAMEIITYGKQDVALAPYGEYWRQMRKICVQELLSAKQVQSFKSIREEEAANLIRSIRSAGPTTTINLTEKLAAYTSSVISRSAFGRRQCAEQDEFLSVFDEVKKLTVSMDFADFFPSWGFVGTLSGIRRTAWGLRRRFDLILEKIIREHKERKRLAEDDDDVALVDVLLRIEEQGGLQVPLTGVHVKATILDIFAGGSDTSSILMDWTMTELMRNPRAMIEAQAEVREALRGKEVVTQDDIQELHYLKLVIKETLRLHPPIPLLSPRKCRETCEVGGYQIPKNTTVIVNAWALGRDPQHWDEPETFWPERFESNSGSINYKGSDFEFIPFGAGRRMCPGMLFSMAAVELIISQLLYYFDWKLPRGMQPEDMDMNEVAISGWNRAEPLSLHAIPYEIN